MFGAQNPSAASPSRPTTTASGVPLSTYPRPPPTTAPTMSPRLLKASTRSTSHRGGLPARSSRWRSRAACPSGPKRPASRASPCSDGVTTRSTNGRSISVRCSEIGAVRRARIAASERPTWRRSSENTPMVPMPSTSPANTAPSPAISTTWADISDLHPDDLAHPQGSDHQRDDEDDEHRTAERVGIERPQVPRPYEVQVQREDQRQGGQDVRRQPALRREHPDLPAQPFPLAQR